MPALEVQTPVKPFLTATEVSRLFCVDRSTVNLWVRKGKLHPLKTLGGNFRFRRETIMELLNRASGSEEEIKKKDPRFPVSYPIRITALENRHWQYNGSAVDISANGIGLMIDDHNGLWKKLSTGIMQAVKVDALDESGNGLSVTGTIKGFHAEGTRRIRLGVELDK